MSLMSNESLKVYFRINMPALVEGGGQSRGLLVTYKHYLTGSLVSHVTYVRYCL